MSEEKRDDPCPICGGDGWDPGARDGLCVCRRERRRRAVSRIAVERGGQGPVEINVVHRETR